MLDGNSGAGAPARLFAPIQAPKIIKISRKAIQDFLADREAYEDAIEAQSGMNPVPWRSCFPASYLRSLVRARIFGAAITDVANLTDEIIKEKLLELTGGPRTVSAEEALAEVKRNILLDASEPDASLRVLMLSASYLELCDKRGWNFVEKAPKVAVKHILSVLQPPRLKQRVEDALALEESILEDKYFDFIDFVAEKAVIFEEVMTLKEYRRTHRPTRKPVKDDKPLSKPSAGPSRTAKPKEDPKLPLC